MNFTANNTPILRNIAFFILIGSAAIVLLYPHIVPMPSNSVFDLDFHGKLSYVFEVIIFNLVFLGLILLFRKFWFSVFLVVVLYMLVIAVNTVKINILEVPFYHTDLIHAGELLLQWSVLKHILIWMVPSLTLIAFVLKFIWTKERRFREKINGKLVFYFSLMIASVIFFSVIKRSEIRSTLVEHNLYFSKINGLVSAADLGYLTLFFQKMLLESSGVEVYEYNKNKVASIVKEHGLGEKNNQAEFEKPNIIYVLVEAFTNPDDFGWDSNYAVLPVFNGIKKFHSGGRLFSPVVGGKSANAEFELLTGMSMRFFPANSIPYTDHIVKDMPSIVSFLNNEGYFTSSIHMASLSFFNYKEVYRYLGFDEIKTLWGKEGVNFNALGNYPAPDHWVKEVVQTVEDSQSPAFVFTFPSYPHGPWDYDNYSDSSLDITNNSYMSVENRKRYKNYTNILHETDQAIGEIVKHFKDSDEKTVIVVLGDHQPFLADYNSQIYREFEKSSTDKDVARIFANYQVPVAIWSNYGFKTSKPIDFSMNFFTSYFLEEMGFNLSGFMKLNGRLREEINIFNWIIKYPNGVFKFEEPPQYKDLIDDYRTLQYDLIQGEQYHNSKAKD